MKTLFCFTALLLPAVLAGCGGGGDENPKAEFAFRMAKSPQTAAPSRAGAGNIHGIQSGASGCGLEHVWVTVRAIMLDRTDASSNADSTASELALLPPRRIDLVGLTDGLLAKLGTGPLAAGHYGSLRLLLTDNEREGAPDALANAVQANGASPTPLLTPAAAHSGIKVALDLAVGPGEAADVVLDFDPCTSVVQAGNSGRYILKPVLSARPLAQRFVAESPTLVAKGVQSSAWVGPLANGGYLSVWTDAGVTRAQRYDAAGEWAGGELLLHQSASASVATGLAGGGFAIAVAGTGSAVSTLQLDASGAVVRSAQTFLTVSYPLMASVDDIDPLPDGGYLVTGSLINVQPFSDQTYHVRRFDASGAPVGDLVSAGTRFGSTGRASTSVLPSGGWVSTSTTINHPLAPRPFYNISGVVKLFDGMGAPVASLLIDPYPGADEGPGASAGLRDGNFVVAWHVSPFVAGLNLPPVELQVFDQTGAAASAVVPFDPRANAGSIRLTAVADGGFLLTTAVPPEWESPVFTVLGQYFDATARARGSMFELGRSWRSYGLAANAGGGFVFTSRVPSATAGDDVYETQFDVAGELWQRPSRLRSQQARARLAGNERHAGAQREVARR